MGLSIYISVHEVQYDITQKVDRTTVFTSVVL